MSTISKLAKNNYLTTKCYDRQGNVPKFLIVHHMAAHWTGPRCAQYFQNNGLENSANYCIGYDGSISCNVVEEYGGWTSGCNQADRRAITIECSDSMNGKTTKDNWIIPDATQEALIQLMVDIIQRYPSYGGKAVYDPDDQARVATARQTGDWSKIKGNILFHYWTAPGATTCPEWHMIQIMPDIVKEVNRRLSGEKRSLFDEAEYMIHNGINGRARESQARADGYEPATVQAEIDLILAKDKTAVWKSLSQWYQEVKYGSTGLAVQILQTELKRTGYYTGAVDGIAGDLTVEAIKKIQKNWNIVYGGFAVDGVFGTACWQKYLIG